MNLAGRFSPAAPLVALLIALNMAPPLAAFSPPPDGDNDYDDSGANLFRDGEVALIEVIMDQADLLDLLANPWGDDYRRCTVRFSNSVIDETVEDVGIRVRGNTSRSARKKSWKLSFNSLVRGRQFHGIEKMNLNGERNDPTVTRSMLSMDLHREMGVPAPRIRHVRLKINDGAYVNGVYVMIEQVDEEFAEAWFDNKDGSLYKCLYRGYDARPADLRYVAPGTPETYAALGGGEVYAEKNLDNPDWEDITAFIDFLNFSDDATFADALDEWMHLDNFLRAMAVDVAVGGWDNYWYGANNYYLYRNEETGRFEWVPWDGDNSFGADWFGIDWANRSFEGWGDGGFGSTDGALPVLIERVLSNPVFKGRIEGYLRELSDGPLSLMHLGPKLDTVRELLEPYIFKGSFANGHNDWNFTPQDFQRAFTAPQYFIGGRGADDFGLKPFISTRQSYLRLRISPPAEMWRLRVNEVLAENRTGAVDEAGDREDWVEIRWNWPAPIDIGGMYLSDDPDDRLRWRIPDGTSLVANGFLQFWCDGDEDDGPLHTNFRLGAGGECVILSHDDENHNVVIDALSWGAMGGDVSFGRDSDVPGGKAFFNQPTPGADNIYTGNVNPRLTDPDHDPAAPGPNEPVTVSVAAVDLDGAIEAVTLSWSAGGKYRTMPMVDDGTGGDEEARDRIFTAVLGGRSAGERVRYFVSATDDSGSTAESPVNGASEPRGWLTGWNRPTLAINEIMADAGNAVTGSSDDAADWLEIHNTGGKWVSLGGLELGDDLDGGSRLVFSDIALEPHGFLVVICDARREAGELHAPFRLSRSGETVGIFGRPLDGGAPIDTVTYGAIEPGRAWARTIDGGGDWVSTGFPTRGISNSNLNGSGGSGNSAPAGLAVWPSPARSGVESTIAFSVTRSSPVRLGIYDIAGRQRALIVDDQRLAPGARRIRWDLTDGNGEGLPPGVYMLRLETGGRTETARLVLIR